MIGCTKGAKSLVLLILIMNAPRFSMATEFHVAPDGKPDGVGSRDRPWDLQTALSHPETVKPGDTIWLHGGTYKGSFKSELKGRDGARIIVRQAHGERAVIEIEIHPEFGIGFYCYGEWTQFRDFEVTCTNPKRRTEIKGSWPNDLQRGSIECRGSHLQFINLVVHDLGLGFGYWSGGAGGEIYGCVIYNNGWGGPDRGHGHGIYAQNKESIKKITDNVIFQQFGSGMHVYGSEKASLKGFRVIGNVTFNNGSLYRQGQRTRGILVGGAAPLEDVIVEENMTFSGGLQLGYSSRALNKSLVARKNYTVGASIYFQDHLDFEENTVIGGWPVLTVVQMDGGSLVNHKIDRNVYYNTNTKHLPFSLMFGAEGQSLTLADWRKKGFDKISELHEGQPKGAKVFIRPNEYESGRANIIVYNWDEKPTVEVDLKNVLKAGQRFQIVSARNIHGPAIVSGAYEGEPVLLPMTPVTPAQPIGMPDYEVPEVEPKFGVYVVLPE